ncbi:MAG: glycosyltransferase [Selenomonadaceae bacterium]|nr:glycosyltransferase [Selenomonadaceae bacterium]
MRKLKPTKKIKSKSQIKSQLKITACYITKNEENNLPRSINSLKSQVDEIVIVDTGSTDQTIEVAKTFGAKVLNCEWTNDFSKPRNMALDNATGDWILFLDADEFFSKETAKNIRPLIEKADKEHKEGILVNLINIDVDRQNKVLDTTYLLRAFRNFEGYKYVGRIHEELHRADNTTLTELSLVPTEILTLYHTGYSTAINADKARRNLKMLLAELELTDQPERIYGYIAQCYNGLKDYINAEKYAIKDINGGRRDTTFASSSYRILLNILAREPRRIVDRIKYSAKAVKDFPETPEFHAEHAECLIIERKFPEAIAEMETALKAYANYDGLEPMLFNNTMAKMAKERLEVWKADYARMKGNK